MNVTVKTYANIALLKYWGKRDETLFLPTKNSFSLSLDALTTNTTMTFAHTNQHAITVRNMIPDEKTINPIRSFLDHMRQTFAIKECFSLSTHNTFPTAAGIASSASGFAALTIGINTLCSLGLSQKELSIVARQGSGSAARSIFGGFVWWHKGTNRDGSDSYAQDLFTSTHWPELRVLIVITQAERKSISSRYGMAQTIKTSPRYHQWLEESAKKEQAFITAIAQKDFYTLGVLTEQEWDGFHQSILQSSPCLCYWNQESYALIKHVQQLRENGISCFFTTDAGPQVKIICLEQNSNAIKQSITQNFPTTKIIESGIASHPLVNTHEHF
jgi:diphosphomevalonate decarboxylase